MTSIHAAGTAELRIAAEHAIVSCHVAATSTSRESSIREATALHTRVIEHCRVLQQRGWADAVTATAISTETRRNYGQGSPDEVTTDYRTTSRLTVTLTHLDAVSELATEFAEWGVETHVTWALTDETRRRAEREARIAAVAESRQIAEDYAYALGVTIAEVVSLTDSRDTDMQPRVRMAAMSSEAVGGAEVTVADITVTASVVGSYEAK